MITQRLKQQNIDHSVHQAIRLTSENRKKFMNGYLPKNEIVFFNPGKTGIVFIHAANTYITVEQLIKTQEHYVQLTSQPVIYIEDRRMKKRVIS